MYNRQEAEIEVKRDPFSFLQVDRAETSFGPDVETYAPCVYDNAGQLLQGMIDDGTSVSYTHLDVYKRQDLEQREDLLQLSLTAQSRATHRYLPVSYTHRDVYKRQD